MNGSVIGRKIYPASGAEYERFLQEMREKPGQLVLLVGTTRRSTRPGEDPRNPRIPSYEEMEFVVGRVSEKVPETVMDGQIAVIGPGKCDICTGFSQNVFLSWSVGKDSVQAVVGDQEVYEWTSAHVTSIGEVFLVNVLRMLGMWSQYEAVFPELKQLLNDREELVRQRGRQATHEFLAGLLSQSNVRDNLFPPTVMNHLLLIGAYEALREKEEHI